MANMMNPNDKDCGGVVCRDGKAIWAEERDHETFPTLPATTNVVAGFATIEEAFDLIEDVENERERLGDDGEYSEDDYAVARGIFDADARARRLLIMSLV